MRNRVPFGTRSIAGILSRNLAVATQETTGTGCEADRNARPNTNQGLQMPMWTVDISDERNPREIAQLPPPADVEASCKDIVYILEYTGSPALR
jgi:hypothetical protein